MTEITPQAPLFPIPPGYRLLDPGDTILKGDTVVHARARSFDQGRPTVIDKDTYYAWEQGVHFYFRYIPEGEAPKAFEGSKLTSGDPIPPIHVHGDPNSACDGLCAEEARESRVPPLKVGAGAEAPTEAEMVALVESKGWVPKRFHTGDFHRGPYWCLPEFGETSLFLLRDAYAACAPVAPPVSAGDPPNQGFVDMVDALIAHAEDHERCSGLAGSDIKLKDRRDALLSRFSALEGALECAYKNLSYLGDRSNWESDCEDGYNLLRLGRPEKIGGIPCSRHIAPWVFAKEAAEGVALSLSKGDRT